MTEQQTSNAMSRAAAEKGRCAREAVPHLEDDWTITVCDACLCACCWQGELYCYEAHHAATTDITIAQAKKMALENAEYWTKDENVIPRLLAKGVYA